MELKTFDKCPSCGSTNKIAQGIIDDLKKEGKIRSQMGGAAMVTMVILMDPAVGTLRVTQLTTMYDICAECGALYCILAKTDSVPAPTLQQMPPMPMERRELPREGDGNRWQ